MLAGESLSHFFAPQVNTDLSMLCKGLHFFPPLWLLGSIEIPSFPMIYGVNYVPSHCILLLVMVTWQHAWEHFLLPIFLASQAQRNSSPLQILWSTEKLSLGMKDRAVSELWGSNRLFPFSTPQHTWTQWCGENRRGYTLRSQTRSRLQPTLWALNPMALGGRGCAWGWWGRTSHPHKVLPLFPPVIL